MVSQPRAQWLAWCQVPRYQFPSGRVGAEVAQLRDALARRQQIGVATGLLAQEFAISPDRAWSLMVRFRRTAMSRFGRLPRR